MYEQFFGFSRRPFSMAPDPHFLFLSAQHRSAAAQLEQGLANEASFCLVTGEIGSGKTTIIRHLLNRMERTVKVGLIGNTSRNISQLLQWVSLAFELPFEGVGEVTLQKQFQEFLIREYAEKRRVVLIVDEAQNLGRRNLEELRLLSNINVDQHLLLQVILAGQPELRTQLESPQLRQFAQRIAVDCHLGALSAQETGQYIWHRLHVAGGRVTTFSNSAIWLIYLASRGVPRVINRICDSALVLAFNRREQRVGHAIVEEVVKQRRTEEVFPYPRESDALTSQAPIMPAASDSVRPVAGMD
jgi:type II secretory pathway predicted ATPase ExeA